MIDSVVEEAARAYKFYCKGDALTDAEVKAGAKVFWRLAQELRAFGPRFDLAATEFALKAEQFRQFDEHRKRDKRDAKH